MKSNKTDIKSDILFMLAGGLSHSLGEFNRALKSKWTQNAIKRELLSLVASGEIVALTRWDYFASDRHKVTAYLLARKDG